MERVAFRFGQWLGRLLRPLAYLIGWLLANAAWVAMRCPRRRADGTWTRPVPAWAVRLAALTPDEYSPDQVRR